MTPHDPRRTALKRLLAITVGVTLALVLYVAVTSTRHTDEDVVMSSGALTLREITNGGPFVLFRHTSPGAAYGRIVVQPLGSGDATRYATSLSCDRVHFAGGRGVCLTSGRGTPRAIVFDSRFRETAAVPLPGIPSRARLSGDGRRAAVTVFVSGHSYAAGGFSTSTWILDTSSGTVLTDLEAFAVTRDGQRFSAVDFNFWGVTFASANRIYATLSSGGEMYLVEGDVDARTARVIRGGVECPSLSPDGTRVVYKRRQMEGIRLVWKVTVLELATGVDREVGETRSVDDQSEWLDDDHVVYGLPSETRRGSTDLWVARADGSTPPRLFAANAWSPAFARGAAAGQ